MIELKHIVKYFNKGTVDENTVFDGFDFTVHDHDFISVIGSNGSGKTTMLNLICGSMFPDGGQIIADGVDITNRPEYRRAANIGRVFQDPKMGTSSELTILENMALADNKGRVYGLTPGINKRRISYYRTLLEQCGMGLENRMNTQVGTLSGGQRQALALVIATMTDLKLLILDEHTAALDPKAADIIMELTQKVVSEKKLTTLMVTHNLRYALEYGNRMVMMHEGHTVIDISDAEKRSVSIDDILARFNEISIERGN